MENRLSDKMTGGSSLWLGCVGVVLLILTCLISMGMACDADMQGPDKVSLARPDVILLEQWGVEVSGIRFSGAGRILDFAIGSLIPRRPCPSSTRG